MAAGRLRTAVWAARFQIFGLGRRPGAGQALDEPGFGNALCWPMRSENRQDGTTMADDKGKSGEAKSGEPIEPRGKDSRQDRLKSALRENLKRRKMQARERDKGRDQARAIKNDTAASDDEASPDGELGKRAD